MTRKNIFLCVTLTILLAVTIIANAEDRADALYQGPQLAPDGTYVQGPPTLAPDGTYVGGEPQLAPDGSYVGSGRSIYDGGTWVGQMERGGHNDATRGD